MQAQRNTIFVPAGEGEQLKVLGMTHFTKVSPEDTGGQFTAIVIDIPPECGPPMHSHEADSEFFFVLEGTLTLSDPDGDIEAKPGDFCYLRGGGSHAFRNNTDSHVRALAMVTPGNDAHRFFKQIDAELDGAVDVPVVLDVAARHGIEFPA
uniref:cupin domain-containing protein n=1 Tax=Altererythrobacter segetis TaxID=1104773 RepID=UPI0014089C22|nr:cupin domain-containing protein [Altererythrobacter segetis]